MIDQYDNLIEILGTIGVGKTTLLQAFPDSTIKIFEPVEGNPFLNAFYTELQLFKQLSELKYTYNPKITPLMEAYLSCKRAREIKSVSRTNPNKYIVTDWGRSEAFIQCLYHYKVLTELDLMVFDEIINAIDYQPKLIIYLDNIEFAWENVKKRNRQCECNITKDYLITLDNAYKQILTKYQNVEIIHWDNSCSIKNLQPILAKYQINLS